MVGTQLAVFIAGVCGIVPTLGLLMLISSPYEKYFEDKDIFLSFGFGFIFGGVLVIAMYWLSLGYLDPDANVSPLSTLIVGVLIALLATLMITVFTNRKKNFNKTKAKFVGLAVACGLSTSIIFYKVFADLQIYYSDESGNINFYFNLILFCVSVVLINAAAGIAAGDMTSKAMFKLGIMKCFGVLVFYYPWLFFHMIYYDPFQQWLMLVVLIGIATFAFIYQYTRNIRNDLMDDDEKKGGKGKKKKGSRRRRRRR